MSDEFFIERVNGLRYLCFGQAGSGQRKPSDTDLGPLSHVCRMSSQQRVPIDGGDTLPIVAEYESNGWIVVTRDGKSTGTGFYIQSSPFKTGCYPVVTAHPQLRVYFRIDGGRLLETPVLRAVRHGDKRVIQRTAEWNRSYSDPICDFIAHRSGVTSPDPVTITDGRMLGGGRDGPGTNMLVYMHDKASQMECVMTIKAPATVALVSAHFGLPESLTFSDLRAGPTVPASDSGWSSSELAPAITRVLERYLISPLAALVVQFTGHPVVDMEHMATHFTSEYARYMVQFMDHVKSYGGLQGPHGPRGGLYAPDTFQMWCRWMLCCDVYKFLHGNGPRACPFDPRFGRSVRLGISSVTVDNGHPFLNDNDRVTRIDRLMLVVLFWNSLLPADLFPEEFGIDTDDITDIVCDGSSGVTIYM